MDLRDEFDGGVPSFCDGCSHRQRAGVDICWLCGRHVEADVAARQLVQYVGPFGGSLRWQFSLKALLLFTTFASAILALFVAAPVAAILVVAIALPTVPAVLRMCALNQRYRESPHPLTLGIRALHFFTSFMLLILIGWAGPSVGLTARAVFTRKPPGDLLASIIWETILLVVSVAPAVCLMWFLIRLTWPKKNLPPGTVARPRS